MHGLKTSGITWTRSHRPTYTSAFPGNTNLLPCSSIAAVDSLCRHCGLDGVA